MINYNEQRNNIKRGRVRRGRKEDEGKKDSLQYVTGREEED